MFTQILTPAHANTNRFARSHAARIAAVLPPPAPKRKPAATISAWTGCPTPDQVLNGDDEVTQVWRVTLIANGEPVDGSARVFMGVWDSVNDLTKTALDILRQEWELDAPGSEMTSKLDRLDTGAYKGPFQVRTDGNPDGHWDEFADLATAVTEADAIIGFVCNKASVVDVNGTEIVAFTDGGYRMPGY